MSDSPNPPSPNRPNRNPDSTGINWRLVLMLSLGLMLVSLVFFNPVNSRNVDQLSYSEFLKIWDQGRVITDQPKDKPLVVVTKDNPSLGSVSGYYLPAPEIPKDAERETIRFRVPVNVQVQKEELDRVLGSNVPYRQVAEFSDAEDGRIEISFNDFTKAMALDQVLLGNSAEPLEVASQGNLNALILGTMQRPKTIPAVDATKARRFDVPLSMLAQQTEVGQLLKGSARFTPSNEWLKGTIFTFLPVFLLVLLLFFLFRQQMKSAGRGAMSFGKSKARLLTMDRNKVTFKDVAGIQEAKEELVEIVEYLRDPRKFQKLGGSIPKGVLMVGPPGTGKTLLARAIAGEADVPFFSISGSDFVEMFVGVGASRVRDMFEQGKKHAPCLIFIDEIDAVGRHRGHGMGGGHDEREQTLNALLVEMDGFDSQEGIIIIAATNRPDVLDAALLRPGRFDRQVTVALPDVNGREEILKVHSKKIKLAANVDLSVIARGTPGFSGAELANLINEAALLAARKNLTAVTLAELEEARDKVRWGRERRSLAMSDKEKENTAYHEAGHAILNVLLEHTDPLHKVTIIPRGPALGVTMMLPTEDRVNYRKAEILDQLIVLMGGRVAEEIVFGNVTSGAVGDIRMATNFARNMVCYWGMSDNLGMVEYGENESQGFGGRTRSYSEATQQRIDSEIKELIDHAYQEAMRILLERRETMEIIAKALLEYETLDGDQIKDLIEHGEMKNPPTTPKPPEIPDEYRKPGTPKPEAPEEPKDDGPLPGSVVGQPA